MIKNESMAQKMESSEQSNLMKTMERFVLQSKQWLSQILSKEKILEFTRTLHGRVLLISLSAALLVLLIAAIFSKPHTQTSSIHGASTSQQRMGYQADEIDTINQDINQIKQQVTNINNVTQTALTQLTQQMQTIQSRVQQLSDQNDIKQMTQTLSDSNQQLSQKLNDMDVTVKQVLQPQTFIDPKNLPFKVVSADIWGGTPYVTIDMDNKESLVGVNESHAGWTVDSIDFTARVIIFRNDKQQYIKIQLDN